MTEKQINQGLEYLKSEFGETRIKNAIAQVKKFNVEVPSWIFGAFGGGRFGEYTPPGCARNVSEKLSDAAFVYELTGATGQVAMHVLWDFSDDGKQGSFRIARQVAEEAADKGLKLGSINPTYFLRGSHRGSLSAPEEETRKKYIDQTVLAAEIADKLASRLVAIWLPDGSNYPGQIDLQRSIVNTRDSLRLISAAISRDIKVLIEYKVFEPGTYSTEIADWGSAYLLVREFGPNAGVLVDLGHHFHSANIEQIVARLIDTGIYAGFHFNTRYAADDDHSVEPNGEMARIFYQLVNGDVVTNSDPGRNWAYMIDQCSGRENRMHAILHSVDSLQASLAKALLVDDDQLARYQNNDEIILANRFYNNALLNADVRPVVMAARLEKNLPADPVQAYVASGYQEKIEQERA